jgi:hypothetical protein
VDRISFNKHRSHCQPPSQLGDRRIGETHSAFALGRKAPHRIHMAFKLAVVMLSLLLPFISLAQQADNDFKVFWGKFKNAVITSDGKTVASLSKFPIGMSYGIRSIKTKSELLRRYKEVFSQQTDAVKCFATKEPEKDSTNPRKYSVACPDAAGNEVVIYEFERGASGWKFVRLDNINE